MVYSSVTMRYRILYIFITITMVIFSGIAHAQGFITGYWEGSMKFVDGVLPIAMRLVEQGALLDIPSQNLYGFPCASSSFIKNKLVIVFAFGNTKLTFDGVITGTQYAGNFTNGNTGGSFELNVSKKPLRRGESALRIPVNGAVLPGTLLVPQDIPDKVPLVIFHSGLGVTDRNGNNYNIAGKNDAIKQLAEALQLSGVASFRYDKRGAGEAYWLVKSENELSPKVWTNDFVEIIKYFKNDSRFSSIWIMGIHDGALIAAAAAQKTSEYNGIIIACSSAYSPYETYFKSIEDAPQDKQAEGKAILESLKKGKKVTNYSEFYASAFRISFQNYLIELFTFDLKRDLAKIKKPILVIQGDRDMQVTYYEYTKIMEAVPHAKGIVIPEMNHVLKLVSPFMDDNNKAFSDPAFPIPLELLTGILDFIKENQ